MPTPVRTLTSLGTFVAVSILCALAWNVPAAKARDTAKSAEYFEDAVGHAEAGEFRAAIVQLKNALQNDPDNVKARLLLGQLYIRVGNGASSEKELRTARKLGAADTDVIVDLGRAYLLQNKNEEILNEVLPGERGPEVESAIMVLRGNAHLRLEDVDQAADSFGAAIELSPENALAKLGMANVWRTRGKLEDAEASVDEALSLAPESSQGLLMKGELRRLSRDPEGALASFEKAIELQPEDIRARLGRAAVLLDLRRDDDARAELSRVDEKVPDFPMTLYLSAVLQAKERDYAGAQATLQKAGKALSNHLPSIFLLGSVHYAQGQFEQAVTNLQRFVDAVPRHVAARKLLGASLIRKNQPDVAVEILEPVIEAAPDDPQLLGLMGNALMRSRQFSEATAYFEKAAAASPESIPVQTQLALSQLATGAAGEAVSNLEAALDADPEATRPGILLALTHLRGGDFDGAIAAADLLTARLADNPLPYNLKGAAYLGKGDNEAARKTFEEALRIQPDYFPAEMNLAQMDIRAGDTDGAKRRFLGIVERDTAHVGAMMALADLARRNQDVDGAIDWLEKARAANTQAALPRLRLIDVYIATRKPEKALIAAHELEQLAPRSPEALDALGRARMANGEPDQAVRTYLRLVDVAPSSTQARLRLAQAQAAANDADGARASLRKAIEIDPESVPAISALTEVEARSGRSEEALRVADGLRRKRPDSPVGHMLVGDVMMAEKKFAEAAASYETAFSKQQNGALALRLYRARWSADDRTRALDDLAAWVEGNADDRAARLVLAGGLLNTKRYDESMALYEALLDEVPDNAVILNNLAWLYQQKGDPRAVEMAERAHEVAPESPRIMDTLGWILVQSDDAARGVGLLEQARDKLPLEPDVLYHYAVGLHRVGRSDEAAKYLRNLVNFYGDFASVDDARALLDEIGQGGSKN